MEELHSITLLTIANVGYDRFYTIKINGDYLGLALTGGASNQTGAGVDKGNGHLYFDKYGPDANGGAISFVEALPLGTPGFGTVADVNFAEVLRGATATKTLIVSGSYLENEITYALGGADAGAFTAVAATFDEIANKGGTATITFSQSTSR